MDPGSAPLAVSSRQQPVNPLTPSLSRRYACDRCRGHKLRCNRDLTALFDSPCQRCRKAKAKCTIGSGSSWRTAVQKRQRASTNEDNTTCNTAALNVQEAQALTADPASPKRTSRYTATESASHADWEGLLEEIPSGSLALDSISWEDVFDYSPMAFNSCTGKDIENISPTPTSLLTLGSSKNPTGQEGTASNCRLDVSSVLPDTTGTDTVSEAISDAPQKTTPRPLRKDSAGLEMYDIEHFDQNICHSEHEIEPEASVPRQSSPWTEGNNQLWKDHRPEIPIFTFATLNDRCIHALSNLSTTLMRDLRRINEYQPNDLFVLAQSNTQSENVIGKMLQGSEQFLDIIHSAKQPFPARADPLSEQSLDAHVGNYVPLGIEGMCEAAPVPSCRDHRKTTDLPCTFAILACYTCLINIHEIVFSAIQKSLETSNSITVASTLPAVPSTIHGLQINGFVLQNHRTLQLKILIQVGRYMLDSIEKALRDAQILDDLLFQTLLKAGLQRKGRGYASAPTVTGMGVVRDILKRIETMLSKSE